MAEDGFADFRGPVAVIGAAGRMGGWLVERLKDQGIPVLEADASRGPWDPAALGACPVVVLAVPVAQVEPVMLRLGPHTRPDGVVVDLGSVKQGPLAAMLAHARGQVVGCHPLFGPSAPGLEGQTVFLCPGRGRRWLALLQGWLARRGAVVSVMEAPRHDRLMARVQSLRHMTLFAFGLALESLGLDEAELDLAGPWFRQLVGMLAAQCRQPAGLYADLAHHNPFAGEALTALANEAGRIAQAATDPVQLDQVLRRACEGLAPVLTSQKALDRAWVAG